MTTMNLRTRAYGSKALKNAKIAEILPEFPGLFCTNCDNQEIPNLMQKLTESQSFDFQAQTLRNVILKLPSSHKCVYVKAIVFWFFHLDSNSSLRSVISSSLNKTEDHQEFQAEFDTFIQKVVGKHVEKLDILQKCFENCHYGLTAVKSHIDDIYPMLADKLVASTLDELPQISRVLLSLESIRAARDEVRLAQILCATLFAQHQDENLISTEIRTNLCLIWSHELRSKMDGFSVLLAQKEDSILDLLPKDHNSMWNKHISMAAITTGESDLLQSINGTHLILEHFYDIIEQCQDDEYTRSHGILLCASKHLNLAANAHDNIEAHLRLARKYEKFALSNLSSANDRIRHNVKNVLVKVLELYSILKVELEAVRLVESVLDLSWESKAKCLALSVVAKFHGPLLVKLNPDIAHIVIGLMADPTIEASAADLYENLLLSCYGQNDLQHWIQSWIWPLLKNQSQGSISTMRLLRVALKINADLVMREIVHCGDEHFALICLKLDKIKGGSQWRHHFANLVTKAALHFEDSIRIQALDLVISSHSSREDFSMEELALIHDTLELNMVLQQPSDRQNFIVLMKKLALRIKAAMTVSSRKNDPDDTYQEFIEKLAKFYFNCFFPDASFSRRSIALSCLQDLLSTFPEMAQNRDICSVETAEKLVDALFDSYELNKQMALDILEKLPTEVTLLNDPDSVKMTLNEILELTRSHKPPDSLNAAYLTKYLSLSSIKPDLMSKLLSELEHQLEVAQKDLCQASITSPMYGVLNCIRFLVDSSHPDAAMASALLKLGQTITKVIEPVLNNDSPEGHLPMDLTEEKNGQISAQLLLLCAWRTSKEISLLFGQLCPFLANEEVVQLSHFFTQQLAEIKHRGAFEQAYIGFCSLCSYMWKTEGFQAIPNQMLLATIQEIGNDDQNRLCSTRRSAGIPFLIQGIVTTEPAASNFQSVKIALSHLIRFSQDPDRAEIRIHACNILRVLYRDASLGDIVSNYVADGVKAAICGFKSRSWSERNSATLLFSALCTRIFGVKRSKADLSGKNSMSARMFFHRFPDLYPFLLQQVSQAAQVIGESPNALSPDESSIYPALLILAKLTPTTTVTEVEDIKFQLSEFVPFLEVCGGSSILKIRQLSALALVSIYGRQKSVDFLREKICVDQVLSHNQCHGKILQLLYLLQLVDNEDSAVKADLKKVLLDHIHNLEKIFNHTTCGVLRSSLLEVALILKHQFGLACNFNYANASQTSKVELAKSQELRLKFQLSPPTSLEGLELKKAEERLACIEAFGPLLCTTQDDLIFMAVTEEDSSCLCLLLKRLLMQQGQPCLKAAEAFMAFVNSSVTVGMKELTLALLLQYSFKIVAAHEGQLSEELLFGWLRLLVEIFERSSKLSTFEIKYGLAKGLAANKVFFLKRESTKGHKAAEEGNYSNCREGAISLVMWYVSLHLVVDEDYEVRKEIGLALEADRASCLLFRDLVNEAFKPPNNPSLEKVALLRHLHSKMEDQASAEQLVEGCGEAVVPFEKNETNSWREESKIASIIKRGLDENTNVVSQLPQLLRGSSSDLLKAFAQITTAQAENYSC